MQLFRSPKDSLGDLGAQSAAHVIAASNDLAVVVDGKGVIRDVSFNKDELSLELDGRGRWLGTDFLETVTTDSRAKMKALIQDAMARKPSGWRQVNHPTPTGDDIPVMYSVLDIGRKDRYVVIGRDMRPLANMQQRLISAQQTMERDYIRLRQAETRYRLLFQVAAEGVLIVDSSSFAILDANPAALAQFDDTAPSLLKANFVARFAQDEQAAVSRLLADVRSSGRDGYARVHMSRSNRETQLSVSLFRQESTSLFLVRLSSDGTSTNGALTATALLLDYFERAPDGLVITQHDGSVIRANAAFGELAQVPNDEAARGQPLDRWLGRAGIDFNVAFANLKQNGSVKLYATMLRGELGATTEVEVSAVTLAEVDSKPSFGFIIRDVERRLSAAAPPSTRELPRSVAQLTEMIGRVPLRDLVRETTDVIEKLSIEAALELTGDNRASAAEMLGLSRQSLYVKLRRFGLAEQTSDDEGDDG